MTKLRNIGYLRFGSKILQGFAGFLPPSPLLSPSPLSGSRGQKMRAQTEGAEFYIWGGSMPPPCRPAGGRQAPAKDLWGKNIYFYLHIDPYRPLPGGRPPAAPLPGGRGIKL